MVDFYKLVTEIIDERYLTFLGLMILYYTWIQFELSILNGPLYEKSLEHIKLFRAHAEQHKFMDVLMTLLS